MREPATEGQSGHLRTWTWVVYLLLLIGGIPWYWRWLPVDDGAAILGLPLWVAVAIGASAVTSVFTAFVLMRPWPGESEDDRQLDETDNGDAGGGRP